MKIVHEENRACTRGEILRPGKTRPQCGGNIVSYDVGRPWQNARAAQTQEMLLKIFRNIPCVQDTKFVSATNVARVAKRVNINFEIHHVSNVAAKMCPRFADPLRVYMAMATNADQWT